jgi:hypothetical protein
MRFVRHALASCLVVLAASSVAAGTASAAEIADLPALGFPGPQAEQQLGQIKEQTDASSCDPFALRFAPELVNEASTFRYGRPTVGSRLAHPVCITITLNASGCGGGKVLFGAAYLDTYNPADPLENHLGDTGSGTTGTRPFSFNIPAGGLFALVVSERAMGGTCTSYGYRAESEGPWAEGVPGVAGRAAVGSVLTGTDAPWSDEPVPTTIARNWMRCNRAGGACSAIPGATSPTYTVTSVDLGHTLLLRNTATDSDGTNFTQSRPFEAFLPFENRPTQALTPGDRAHQGFFARGSQQTRCDAPNAPPMVLNPVENYLYDAYPVTSLLNEEVCLVARTEASCAPDGVTPQLYSPAFDPASGLLANYAGSSGNAPFDVGLVSTSLPAGGRREAVVSHIGNGTQCSAYEVLLGADAPFATARPTVTGGRPFNSTTGTWSGNPSFRRSWLRCNASGASCTPIPGATAASYTPSAADTGRRLRVRVTATQGRSVSSDSNPTGVVPAPPRRGGPGGTTAPPLDRTKPVGTIRLGSRDLAKAVKTGRIPVRLTSDEASRATVQVRVTRKLARKLRLRRKVVLARAKGSVPAGRRKTLRAKLTRGARRALRRSRSVKVQLRATFTDAAGNSAKKSRRAGLKRPRRR